MPPSHSIRLLIPADALAYTNIRREMLADSPWSFARTPADDPGCNLTGMAASLALPAGYAIAGAFDGDRLVAVAGIRQLELSKRAHRANIWGVYTTPTHRGQGLARAVISAAIEAARAWPVTPRIESISLSVSEKSPNAHALYLSMGFKPWGTEPDAVRLPDEPKGASETHMLLRFPSSPNA